MFYFYSTVLQFYLVRVRLGAKVKNRIGFRVSFRVHIHFHSRCSANFKIRVRVIVSFRAIVPFLVSSKVIITIRVRFIIMVSCMVRCNYSIGRVCSLGARVGTALWCSILGKFFSLGMTLNSKQFMIWFFCWLLVIHDS